MGHPTEDSKKVSLSQVVMTQLVLPSHTNALGTIFGGTIMSWIDIAAAIAAQRHSGKNVVTASIDHLNFIAPVRIGWVVNLFASVNYAARTSMEIGVKVIAENPKTLETFHTVTAYLTFVAVDEKGKPTPISKLVPETEVEKRRYQEAVQRRDIRLTARK